MNMKYVLNRYDQKGEEKVNFDMFYTSGDQQSMRLLDHMRHYYNKLYHDINFRPMIVTWNCQKDGCNQEYMKKNCVSKGKYCAVETKLEKDIADLYAFSNFRGEKVNLNLNGRDIILEDLRQYCMWDTFVMGYEKGLGTLFNYIHELHLLCEDEVGLERVTKPCSEMVIRSTVG